MPGLQPVLPHPPTHDLQARVDETVRHVRARTDLLPRLALTLGSGLGGVIDGLAATATFETTKLPHWPPSTVPGHHGRLVLGQWQDVPVVVLAGRSHRYEGYRLDQVTFATRVMRSLGAGTMVFTNAVGALRHDLAPGDLMLATDHINWIGRTHLFTPAELVERRAGRRVSAYYDAALRRALLDAAHRVGITLHQGVLLGTQGPSYETASEVRMARASGADAVCMSTVHEVTVAAELGARVACLSCVTNRATGLSDAPLTHAEVAEVAGRAAGGLRAVLDEWLTTETA